MTRNVHVYTHSELISMKIILILIYIYLEDFYDGNTHFVNISILYGRHNLGLKAIYVVMGCHY